MKIEIKSEHRQIYHGANATTTKQKPDNFEV